MTIVLETLNARMNGLVATKLQTVFGTGQERKIMTDLTKAGIDAADKTLKIIQDGITYETWRDMLVDINVVDGPMAVFENEAGDLAQLLEDFRSADLRAEYDRLMDGNVFSLETINRERDTLVARLKWAEAMWAVEDTGKVNDVLTELSEGEPVKAEVILTQEAIDKRIESN